MSFRSDRGNTFALKEAHLKRLVREWDGGDFDISGKDEGLFGNDDEEDGGVPMNEDKPPSPPPTPHHKPKQQKPSEPPPQEQPPAPPQPPPPPQAPQPPPQPPQAQPQPLQIEDTLAQERQRLSNREAQLAHEYANLRQLYEAERSQLALHHGKQQRFTEEAVIQAREDTVKAREEAERLRVDNLALQAALEQQRREADALRAPLLHLMDVDVPAPAPPPAPTTQDLREQQRAAVEAVQRSGNIGGGQMQVDPPEAPLPPQAPPQPPQAPPQPPQVKPQPKKRAHVSETFQTPDGIPPPSQALALIPKPDDKPKAPSGFVGAKKPRLVIDNFTDPHFKQAEQADKNVKELITNATPEEKAAFQSSKRLKKLLDKNLDARHRGDAIYRAMRSILASLKKKENPVAGRNPRTRGYKKGGIVKATGKALVHKGEVVLPAHLAKPLVSKFHQWFKEY